MPKKPKKKNSQLKPVESVTHEDGAYTTQATVLKENKTEGIAIRTAKKTPYLGWRKSFFIQKDMDVNGLFQWLIKTVKELFNKYWQKDIDLISQEDIQKSDQELEMSRTRTRELEDENSLLKKKLTEQEQNKELAKEISGNINQYSAALKKIQDIIKESIDNKTGKEEDIKRELASNRWFLGLDCEVKAKNQDLDAGSEIDLHIITAFGENRIIEAKSPHLPIFVSVGKMGRLNIAPDLSKALSEIIDYMHRANIYANLKTTGTYGVQNPIGIVLAGYNIDSNQEVLLREWNFYLAPYIKIVTYDELISSASKNLELIQSVSKKS